jgi:hypothetical protein
VLCYLWRAGTGVHVCVRSRPQRDARRRRGYTREVKINSGMDRQTPTRAGVLGKTGFWLREGFAGTEELEDGGAWMMLEAVKMMIRWLAEVARTTGAGYRMQMRGAVFRLGVER